MKLRDIEVYLLSTNNDVNDLGATARCVEDFFIRELNNFETGKIAKINIFFREINNFQILEEVSNVIDVYVFFDFLEFSLIMENIKKKDIVARCIYDTLLKVSIEKDWNKYCIIKAFDIIKNRNFDNTWVFKNKNFQNNNKRYSMKVVNKFDISNYEIYVELYDAKKILIGRRIIFKYPKKSFEIESAYWSELNIFSIKFKGPQKIFQIDINDIIHNTPYSMPKKLSDWFKR